MQKVGKPTRSRLDNLESTRLDNLEHRVGQPTLTTRTHRTDETTYKHKVGEPRWAKVNQNTIGRETQGWITCSKGLDTLGTRGETTCTRLG